jgi:hypothetical protein
MTKLQPNFSWQKYLDEPKDQAEQFQKQLQTMHINTANAVNATIDDISYFLKPRPTGETWIDGFQIQTVTVTGTIVGTAITSYPIGATILNLVDITGIMQDTIPITAQANPLPFLNTAGNNVGIWATPTTVVIDATDGTWDGYTFYITLKYTITKVQ